MSKDYKELGEFTMGDIISLILTFIFALLSNITGSDNFRNIGIVSIIVTILAVIIGTYSHYKNTYEWNRKVNNDLFPARYPMTDIEIHRIKDNIYWSDLCCLLSFYCSIIFGLVSIVYLVSIAFSYVS